MQPNHSSIKFFLMNKSKVKIIFNPYIKKINLDKKRYKKKSQLLAVGRFAKQKKFHIFNSGFFRSM